MAESSHGEGKGKLILFGEHAVVYGYESIACSLPRGAVASLSFSSTPKWKIADGTAVFIGDEAVQKAGRLLLDYFELRPEELNIEVQLEVPIGAGLGSSAAMAVAMARAAAELRGIDDPQERLVTKAVAASEAVFHGNASGIDQAAAMGEGFLSFRRRMGLLESTALAARAPTLIVARVAPSASTAKMVAAVAAFREESREEVTEIFQRIERLTEEGKVGLRDGNWKRLGELMNENHSLLQQLRVSTDVLDRACEVARNSGALGAKLTGAGGGGCILAIVEPDSFALPSIQSALRELGDVYTFPPT